MANAERLQYLAAWIQQQVAEINGLVAQAATPEDLRQALAAADDLVSRLRAERRAVTAELAGVNERLDAGRPQRQRHTTWARVEADLLADRAIYEQALVGLEAQIKEQERFRRELRGQLEKPVGAALLREPLPIGMPPSASGRRAASGLRRLAIWVGGGLTVVLLLCGLLASRPPSASVVPTPPTASPVAPTRTTAREVSATEAADLTPRPTEPADAPAAMREPTATATAPAPTASATLLPTVAPSPTETPIPAPAAAKDANLRGGPGTNYPIMGGVRAGQTLEVVERNAAGDWYRLASGAWIAAFLVQNAAQDLPVAAVIPAPPTARPAPSATPLPEIVAPLPTAVPQRVQPAAPVRYCCKVCSAGKACGDSCISRSKTCHKGPGCACQG